MTIAEKLKLVLTAMAKAASDDFPERPIPMNEDTEDYRNHAIEILRGILAAPDKWSFNVVDRASEMVAALEANRPSLAGSKTSYREIVAVDVDGVLHRYHKWKGAAVLDGGPVRGAMEALKSYVDAGFEVHIVSSRLHQPGGLEAVRCALQEWLKRKLGVADGDRVYCALKFTVHRPPAKALIDDRAIRFNGKHPTPDEIKAFEPFRDYDNPQAGSCLKDTQP